MYLGCIHDWHINIFGLYGKWQLRTGENECIYIFFSMYLFASAIIFSLSLGITMPFSKLGYISFPNRDIIFSLSPLQVTSSGGEVHLPYPEYPSSL